MTSNSKSQLNNGLFQKYLYILKLLLFKAEFHEYLKHQRPTYIHKEINTSVHKCLVTHGLLTELEAWTRRG